MFKKLSCFLLIITILFSVASCAKKADTAPLSEQSTAVSVSEESGEVTTTKPAKKEKDNKEQKKTTAKGEKTDKKASESTTAKSDVGKKSQKTNQKATPKKSTSKKSGGKKSQTTTKKQTVTTTKKKDTISVNVTVDCTAAVGKVDGIPNYYLNNFEIDLEKGSTAYSATKAACAKAGVSLTATKTMYGEYISAIGSLAEKATSKYSGWTYTVNGTYPPKAADKYTLENGDTIKWIYKA